MFWVEFPRNRAWDRDSRAWDLSEESSQEKGEGGKQDWAGGVTKQGSGLSWSQWSSGGWISTREGSDCSKGGGLHGTVFVSHRLWSTQGGDAPISQRQLSRGRAAAVSP